jgi:hypothetical protein
MAQKSKLLRNILDTVSDDEVINIAQSFGLGNAQNVPPGVDMGLSNDPVPSTTPPSSAPPNLPPTEPQTASAPINYGQGRVFDEAPVDSPQLTSAQMIQPETEQNGSKLFRPRTVQNIQDEIKNLNPDEMPREESKWKRFGGGLWRGIQTWAENGGQGGLAGLLGATLTGGIGSTVSQDFDVNLKTNQKKQKLFRELGEAQQIADWQTANDYKTTQIENIKVDNNQNAANAKTKSEEFAAKQKETKRANFYRQNKFFDPTKATEAQKRQLAEFDESPESMGAFDFTKADRKTVAGVTYQYNPLSKSFEESNLPKDDSKAVVEYRVKDLATGVTQTYAVASDRAAGLKTSLQAAGMQIEAANTRQDKQILFGYAQLRQRSIEFATELKRKYANDENSRKTEANRELARLLESKNAGRISPEEYDELVKIYQ